MPEDIPLDILFDDELGDRRQQGGRHGRAPGRGHAQRTLVNALLHHVQDLSGVAGDMRPGIVHRLDKGTSGVMVVARTTSRTPNWRGSSTTARWRRNTSRWSGGSSRSGRRIEALNRARPKHSRQKMTTRARRARSAVTRVTWAPAPALASRSFVSRSTPAGPTRSACISARSVMLSVGDAHVRRHPPADCSAPEGRCPSLTAPVPARRAARVHASADEGAPRVHGAATRRSRGRSLRSWCRQISSMRCSPARPRSRIRTTKARRRVFRSPRLRSEECRSA